MRATATPSSPSAVLPLRVRHRREMNCQQELKRVAYELGSIPGARCSPDNVLSRKTLQQAGFVPYAHILNGSIQAP